MSQRPYLNLGAGRIILPGDKPAHHALVPDAFYTYPCFVNIDRNPAPGIDKVMDLFTYPWPLPSNSFDGALLSHLVEHIPHETKLSWSDVCLLPDERETEMGQAIISHNNRAEQLRNMQDGWFAFWSELYRVLTPGARVHVLAPYATSHGFLGDPSHTRPITEQVFQHSMKPDPDAPFEYATGNIHFEVRDMRFGLMPYYQHIAPLPTDPPDVAQAKSVQLDHLLHSQWNVVSDLYCCLECVK